MSSHKKILIVSQNALSLHSNNGKTLTSIFSDWPDNNIAQLYFQEEIPESLKFKNFLRIRDLDIIRSALTFGLKSAGQKVQPQATVKSHYSSSSKIKLLIIDFLRPLNTFKLLLRELLYSSGLWNSRPLNIWIRNFKPDSIFLVGGNSSFCFNIANKISCTYNIPIDIYITDDYVLHAKPNTIIQHILHKKLIAVYKKSYAKTRHAFVIGDEMANHFSREFSREFTPIMNSVKIPSELPTREEINLTSPVDIVYTGSFHLGRDISIINFSKILQSISKKIKRPIILTLYSQQTPSNEIEKLFHQYGIIFCGSLSQSQIPERLLSADFVLHIESFDDKFCNLTKLSVSTKIPEYLVSGSCMIAFGPPQLASIKLISDNEIGICLTSNELHTEDTEKLIEAILSSEKRQEIIKKGFNFAKFKFDSFTTRNLINSLLNTKTDNV